MDEITSFSERYWAPLGVQGANYPLSNCYPCTGPYLSKSASRLSNALRTYATLRHEGETPLFLWDWATFSPGSAGFLVTNKGLYAITGGLFSKSRSFVRHEEFLELVINANSITYRGSKICDFPSAEYTSSHLLDHIATRHYIESISSKDWAASSDHLLKYVEPERSTEMFRYLKSKGCRGDALIGVAHDLHENEEVIAEFNKYIFTKHHIFQIPDGIRRRTADTKAIIIPKYSKPNHYHGPHVEGLAQKIAMKAIVSAMNESEKRKHQPIILEYKVSFVGIEPLFSINDGSFNFEVETEGEIEAFKQACRSSGIAYS